MEYDFVVAPGADPRQIRMAWTGIEGSTVEENGDLLLSTAAGNIRHKIQNNMFSNVTELFVNIMQETRS